MNNIKITVASATYREMERYFKDEKRINLVFIAINYTNFFRSKELTFHPSFAYEVRAVLSQILNTRQYYNVNKQEISRVIRQITNETYLSKLETEAVLDYTPVTEVMKYEPLEPHKKVFNDYARLVNECGFTGLLLDAVVGSGKTYMSLALSVMSDNAKVVILCPKEAVEDVWIESITNELFKRNRQAWSSTSGKEYAGEQYLICHYEYLSKFIPIASELKDVFLIVDEIQFFASQKSQRTKNLNELFERIDIKKSILMSGTPVLKKVIEVISLLRFIDPTLKTKEHYERFLKFHTFRSKFFRPILRDRFIGSIARITGDMIEKVDIQHVRLSVQLDNSKDYLLSTISKNIKVYVKDRLSFFDEHKKNYDKAYLDYIEQLKSRLGNKHRDLPMTFKDYESDVKTIVAMYKRNKLKEIPEVLVRVNGFERVLSRFLEGDDKKNFREAKTVYKYLALKIQGEVLSLVIGKARERAHVDIASVLDYESLVSDSTTKTVIFSKYIAVCEMVSKTLSKKYKVAKAFGKYTKYIPQTIKSFLYDVEVNPIVATYKSLSTGVRLTKASSMLLIDLPFTATELEQSIARVWRLGQDHSVTIYYAALDTGEKSNINSRNIDITKISSEVVESLTGVRLGSLNSEDDEEESFEIPNPQFDSILFIDSSGYVTQYKSS